MPVRKGDLIGAFGPFSLYSVEDISSKEIAVKGNEKPQSAITIYEVYPTLFEVHLRGFNPYPGTRIVAARLSTVYDYSGDIIDVIAIERIDSGEFELRIPIIDYNTGWIPHYRIDFYVAKEDGSIRTDINPWDLEERVKIYLYGEARLRLITQDYTVPQRSFLDYVVFSANSMLRQSFDLMANPGSSELGVDPLSTKTPNFYRTLGQNRLLIMKTQKFLSVKDPVNTWFLLRRKLQGPHCPAHTVEPYDEDEEHLFNIAKADNPFCSLCYGTGIYGAFDSIRKIKALVTTGTVLDATGMQHRAGYIITTTPIKPGDLITNLNRTYIITNQVEVRERFEQPIWFRAPIGDMPYQSPMVRLAIPIIRKLMDKLGKKV